MDYADKLDMMDDDCDIQGFPPEEKKSGEAADCERAIAWLENRMKCMSMPGAISIYQVAIEALHQMQEREQNKPLKCNREEIILYWFDELKECIYKTDLSIPTQNKLFNLMLKDGRLLYENLVGRPQKGNTK